MNKVSRIVKWFLVNGLFLGLMYYGYVVGVTGAKNLVMFFVWVNTFFCLFYMSDTVIEGMIKRGFIMPQWIDGVVDLAIISFFAWVGAWVMASFWTLHTIMEIAARHEAQKRKEAIE